MPQAHLPLNFQVGPRLLQWIRKRGNKISFNLFPLDPSSFFIARPRSNPVRHAHQLTLRHVWARAELRLPGSVLGQLRFRSGKKEILGERLDGKHPGTIQDRVSE